MGVLKELKRLCVPLRDDEFQDEKQRFVTIYQHSSF